jgi:hypothetical protein
MKRKLLDLINDFMSLFGEPENGEIDDTDNLIGFSLIVFLFVFVGIATCR